MSGSLSFSRYLLVEAVESLGLGAIEVEPPVTDEVFLVEDGPVGAQKGVFAEAALPVVGANVEYLALRLGITVVTSVDLAITAKTCVGNFSVDRIILPRNTGNGLF